MRKVLHFALLLAVFAMFNPQAHAECMNGSCHQALAKFAFPHAPVQDDCLSCHVGVTPNHPLAGQKTFKLAAEGASLCFQCHDKLGTKKIVHAPVKDGDCLSCHQVHGAANRYLLDVGEDRSELCFGCHDAEAFKQPSVHGPAAAGACTQCHSPHESAQAALLVAPGRPLCLSCHQDFAQAMQAAPVVHPPVQKDPCTNCHDPHASGAAFVLKKKMPDLCFGCHAEVGKLVGSAKVKHQPVEAAASCGSCHSTHFSQATGLLPTDEKSLCLRCHGNDNLGNPPLKNIKKQLEGKKYLHGPLQQGRCVPCHEPHGSNTSRLLTGPYPDGLYFPYRDGAYDFCLQCHQKNMLRFEETTLYTEFRNGNRNLHFVHVSDKHKARTCRLCHEAHASDGEKLTSREGMPFGAWKIPVRFEATPTGGSCAPGCHQPYRYDRNTPIDYKKGGR